MMMNNNHIILLALIITSLAGCFGNDKPASKTPPPAPAAKRALPAEPLAAYDLAGRRRAKPCPTLGALEAEPPELSDPGTCRSIQQVLPSVKKK